MSFENLFLCQPNFGNKKAQQLTLRGFIHNELDTTNHMNKYVAFVRTERTDRCPFDALREATKLFVSGIRSKDLHVLLRRLPPQFVAVLIK